jgi:hypothetical protein
MALRWAAEKGDCSVDWKGANLVDRLVASTAVQTVVLKAECLAEWTVAHSVAYWVDETVVPKERHWAAYSVASLADM